jgi:hypothetical protein
MATKDDPKALSTVTAGTTQDAPQNTEEARAQSLETLKEQESMKPEPSQEEADEIKRRAATAEGSADYQTRSSSKK